MECMTLRKQGSSFWSHCERWGWCGW